MEAQPLTRDLKDQFCTLQFQGNLQGSIPGCAVGVPSGAQDWDLFPGRISEPGTGKCCLLSAGKGLWGCSLPWAFAVPLLFPKHPGAWDISQML